MIEFIEAFLFAHGTAKIKKPSWRGTKPPLHLLIKYRGYRSDRNLAIYLKMLC